MLFLPLLALAVSASAQDQNNIFLTPPTNGIDNDFTQNPTYVQGSKLTIQWKTTYPATDLAIWQNGNPNAQFLQSKDVQLDSSTESLRYANKFNIAGITGTSLEWTVGTGENPPFDLTKGNVFFFQMYNSSTTTFFSSHYFNVSDPSLASATSTAPSSTTSPPRSASTGTSTASDSSSKTTAATTSAATTTPTSLSADSASDHSSSSSSSSSNSKLGEGLGIGIGLCVFIILVAGLVWYFLRRRSRSPQLKTIDPPYHQAPHRPETASVYPGEMPAHAQYRRYELGTAAPSTHVELDGGGGAKAV
ncbi:uncharacterized protein A1O5_06863 [Cladophialophora psammophila CBS 110553]|uniref:Mid2 domain-containing protein n=1 Tax=Cladophialophora psammophila CBS 110553 TaxID=1182543 RepID=W9WNL1_9EURO|nr:uncharacterized protein A1O5_06863 [Cladophialophora psammophila CBS 110553]EXJ69792.1 hypothetical protein A1O5_06863 [Cladophialophora psammophila CBS 110553]